MFQSIRTRLGSANLGDRLITGAVIMLVLFVGVTVLSYMVLPQGALRGKNPMQAWDESPNTVILAAQIFFFNLISVIFITIGSTFASRKTAADAYFSTGYLVLYTLVAVNAITLGTWSFAIERAAPQLMQRITGIFNILERAALWEMFGQLLITVALARAARVRTTGKETETLPWRSVHLDHGERWAIVAGLGMMIAGAVIEAFAINAG